MDATRDDDRPVAALDHPIWAALQGRHHPFGQSVGAACRYDPDVSPFGALDPAALRAGGKILDSAWADLAALLGPDGAVAIMLPSDQVPAVPDGWSIDWAGEGVQMVGDEALGNVDPGAEPLGPHDVTDMTALVALARPGPFLPRTVELGGYVGRREAGRLVAMAGHRMGPPGHTEVSAVATDPECRGRGLASGLVRHVVHSIRSRGDVPFLHAAASNTFAISLYERLGFRSRCRVTFVGLRAPLVTT